ncbi:2-C-methyl-D-erythritol 4-phosphate cytidylyltransferase [Lacisediminihabitans sp.]|uniref:2-C-methyl-D-erythritol 4-phosphate cytidylyltransferase n=1 Tax=Lacisediminihabitans sp. TaxID=2787631 RepID=UPI002F923D7C
MPPRGSTETPRVGVIVVAAGSGSRLGQPEPKAFVDLLGRPILEHALLPVFGLSTAAQVVVVAPAAQLGEARSMALEVAGVAADYVTVVAGGQTRQASVAAGIAVLDPGIRIVLVHDAARAFTPTHLFETVIAAVEGSGSGVIPGLPVADTIKRTVDGLAVSTVDRSELVAVQTPQGFPRQPLADAYATATAEHTDDAALYAAAGHPVIVVPGDPLAFKITTPWDLRRAEALASSAPDVAPGATRTGVGIDVHAFDESSELWLGGLHWPGEVGLAGHSDGDALSHAICDALLSAAGLGDLGERFGTADERFENAHGAVFIAETVRLVSEAGYAIGNVAAQVVANRPKLAARRDELQRNLSSLVGAPVSVTATTSDGLGFTGRGEGVAVIATALLRLLPPQVRL